MQLVSFECNKLFFYILQDLLLYTNELQYFRGKADVLRSGTFGQGSEQIWLDGLRCMPHFPHLSHCVHNQFGVHDCNHNNDVAVRCSNCTFSNINNLMFQLAFLMNHESEWM